MQVKDIMTPYPLTCEPCEHLGTAMWRMFQGDCGLLPVVTDGRVVGVISDRDIAITVALRGCRAAELMVGEVMQGGEAVATCDPEDSATEIMTLMKELQLHRLPVVDDGTLVGIVSLRDLALASAASANGAGRPTYREIAQTLRAVSAHRAQTEAT
jgi:CBS domain-containing protein